MNMMLKAPGLVDDADLQLTAQLVLKHLRDNHSFISEPHLADLEAVEVEEGRGDVDRLQLNVLLDGGLKVRIDQVWPKASFRNLANLIELTNQISVKVAATINEADRILDMMMEVRNAVELEVARLINKGVACHIISLDLTPIQAGTHDLAVVEVQIGVTSSRSSLSPITIKAEDADDVTALFADLEGRWID